MCTQNKFQAVAGVDRRDRVLDLSPHQSHLQHIKILRYSVVLRERAEHSNERLAEHYVARGAREAASNAKEASHVRAQTRADRAGHLSPNIEVQELRSSDGESGPAAAQDKRALSRPVHLLDHRVQVQL